MNQNLQDQEDSKKTCFVQNYQDLDWYLLPIQEDFYEENCKIEEIRQKDQEMTIEEIDQSYSYVNFTQSLETYLEETQQTKNYAKVKFPFTIWLIDSAIQKINPKFVTDQRSLNWECLDDIYFNLNKLEDQIPKIIQNSKFIEKLQKNLSLFEREASKDENYDVLPIFDFSQFTIIQKNQQILLLEAITDEQSLLRLNFQRQKTCKSQTSSNLQNEKLINFMEKNQNDSYLFRVQPLTQMTLNFLKARQTNRGNNELFHTKILTETLMRNHMQKTVQAKNIRDQIQLQKKYKKILDEKMQELENYQDFLRIISLLRTYNHGFNLFFNIKKEIETFMIHSESLRKQNSSASSYLKNKVSTIFQLNTSKKYSFLIESDCVLCFSCEASQNNLVVYCHKCGQGAHIKCLNLSENLESDYYCTNCQNKEKQDRFCVFCKNSDYILLNEKRKKSGKIRFHMYCQMVHKYWPSTQVTENSFQEESTDDQCSICLIKDESKVLAECDLKCGKKFHSFCAYQQGYLIQLQNWREQKYDDYLQGNFTYNLSHTCEECLQNDEKIHGNLTKLNQVYRRLTLDPEFFFQNREEVYQLIKQVQLNIKIIQQSQCKLQ